MAMALLFQELALLPMHTTSLRSVPDLRKTIFDNGGLCFTYLNKQVTHLVVIPPFEITQKGIFGIGTKAKKKTRCRNY